MPQSSGSAADQGEIYGTGMTAAELKQAGYTDDEVSQLRSDSQAMMASTMAAPGSANENQDQSPSAANGVSQPADMSKSTTNLPAKAESNNHAGMWGLLGLLGLLGLAGRSRRQEVVVQREADSVRDRDRMRVLTERDAEIRTRRDREVAAVREQHDREIAAAERERLRLEAEREASQRAMRDRIPSVAPAIDYTNQDIMAEQDLGLVADRSDVVDESALQENLREKELRDERRLSDEIRDRKVMDIRERERNRRRIA